MKVSIMFESTIEDDGHDQTVVLEKPVVIDLYEMTDFFSDSLRAAGFTYVDSVGWKDDKGNETWSKF